MSQAPYSSNSNESEILTNQLEEVLRLIEEAIKAGYASLLQPRSSIVNSADDLYFGS